jgi:hypothetical protein
MRIHPHDALICEVLRRSKGCEKVLEHVEQCPACQARLTRRASEGRFRRVDYEQALDRSYQLLEHRQAALARERGEAPQLLARLIGLIPERQQLLLRNSRSFQTWGHVMGESNKSIAWICQSLDFIDPLVDPRVALYALHNLADNLATLGRFMQAQRIQARAQAFYQRFREPRVQGRREWVEAKIARGLGRDREAEALLIAARKEFRSVGAEFESTLVSQELAALPAHGR